MPGPSVATAWRGLVTAWIASKRQVLVAGLPWLIMAEIPIRK